MTETKAPHPKLIYFCLLFIAIVCATCKPPAPKEYVTFDDDVAFMKNYTDIITLTDESGKAKVAVSAALQGRVMTSSSAGSEGRSYGWINRDHFKSKDTLEHINVYGGEERFWIGPEGGQFSIFFEKGKAFNLDNWYTPRLIDLEPFDIKHIFPNSVSFTKKASLVNYSGFKFDIGIERRISILSNETAFKGLRMDPVDGINMVSYLTWNTLTNLGTTNWDKQTGLLSIWLLGMFNPSPETTVVIPYIAGDSTALGPIVNDDYFGKVPADRLIVKEGVLYFKGDGKFRSKIGLSPKRAKHLLGSYDAASKILTIVQYNKPQNVTDYVNSQWKIQDNPFAGDVINSYNDGPSEPGKKPLGPFYELETSSPALALKAGEEGAHMQLTCHFEGDPAKLNIIAQKLLGVSLEEITGVFKK